MRASGILAGTSPGAEGADLAMATAFSGREVTLRVEGTLDVTTAPLVSSRLSTLLLDVPGVLAVELDLVGLRHVDAGGMHAIVRAGALARVCGRSLRVRDPRHRLLRTLPLLDPVARLDVVDAPGRPARAPMGHLRRRLRSRVRPV